MAVFENRHIKFSIIVCAFNEEEHLAQCLASLIRQDFDPSAFEIIVVDNESSDATPLIAKKIVKEKSGIVNIRYLRIQHVGLSISRNTGIANAFGDVIVFVDADARVGEGWLEAITSPFERESTISIVAGRVLNLNNDIWFSRFIYEAHFNAGTRARSSTKIGGLTGANMAFRRSVFDITGGFYDGFASYGDETSVAISYLDSAPDETVFYADSAVVFNEHPATLHTWLRQRLFQGRMLFLITYHIANISILKIFIRSFVKSCGLFALFITGYLAVNAQVFLATMSFLIFVLINFARSSYFINAYRGVSISQGKPLGLFGVCVALLGSVVNDAGFVYESLTSLRGKKVSLENSTSKVLENI